MPPEENFSFMFGLLAAFAWLGSVHARWTFTTSTASMVCVCPAQLAPSILTMLGLSPSSLTGVVAENTAVRRRDPPGGTFVCERHDNEYVHCTLAPACALASLLAHASRPPMSSAGKVCLFAAATGLLATQSHAEQ